MSGLIFFLLKILKYVCSLEGGGFFFRLVFFQCLEITEPTTKKKNKLFLPTVISPVLCFCCEALMAVTNIVFYLKQ